MDTADYYACGNIKIPYSKKGRQLLADYPSCCQQCVCGRRFAGSSFRKLHLNGDSAAPGRSVAQLAFTIVAPCPDSSIFFENEGMQIACRDFAGLIHDLMGSLVCVNGGGMGGRTVTGSPDGAVFFQVKLVILA